MSALALTTPTTAESADVAEAEMMAEATRLFAQHLNPLRLYPGGALAVYRGGRLVLDLVSGYADTQCGEPVTVETLFPLFSGTKPFAAVALWQQIERGRLDLDDPVAAHWPAFGQNGKDRVLIRHVLSHRGGFPTTPPALTPDRWGDWPAAISAIEAMPIEYVPGSVSAYHQLTQSWACAEIVRRLDGRSYLDYLREEVIGPLGMPDTYLGLPAQAAHRLVKLHVTDGTDARGIDTMRRMRDVPLHQLGVPGASGVSTARDMASFYAALAAGGALDGARILEEETVARMLRVEVDEETDSAFDVTVRRSLGFELGGLDDQRRHWPGATSTERTFWQGGFNYSVCWGDRGDGLAMAFLTNGIRKDVEGAIARRDLSDAVRAGHRRPQPIV